MRGVAVIALVPVLRDFDAGQADRRFERDQPKRRGEPLGQIGRQGGETVGLGGNDGAGHALVAASEMLVQAQLVAKTC